MTNNYEKIESAVRETILEIGNELPQRDRKEALDLVDAGEGGIAFELLCTQIFEYDVPITREIYDQIVLVGTAMKMEQSTWGGLEKLVK